METKVEESTTDTNLSQISSESGAEDPEDFTEEELKKAEEFKTQGNDYFKCKKLVVAKNSHLYNFRGKF